MQTQTLYGACFATSSAICFSMFCMGYGFMVTLPWVSSVCEHSELGKDLEVTHYPTSHRIHNLILPRTCSHRNYRHMPLDLAQCLQLPNILNTRYTIHHRHFQPLIQLIISHPQQSRPCVLTIEWNQRASSPWLATLTICPGLRNCLKPLSNWPNYPPRPGYEGCAVDMEVATSAESSLVECFASWHFYRAGISMPQASRSVSSRTSNWKLAFCRVSTGEVVRLVLI